MKKTILILTLLAFSSIGFAQTIFVSTGIVRSSTLWRMEQSQSAMAYFGMNFFQIPKSDISVSLGLEYLEKEKWSMTSSVSYYQSGGKLAINERREGNPSFKWDLEKQTYDIPYVGLNTNVNLKVFQQKNAALEAVIGLHGDYVLATENKAELKYDNDDPLGYMNRQGALNRLNGGLNLGARYTFEIDRIKLGFQYIIANKMWNLASYDSQSSSVPMRNNISAFTVTEKASFAEFTFGYNLKKNKQL